MTQRPSMPRPSSLPVSADERLIVALDTPDPISAATAADQIGDAAIWYKIGLGHLATGGLALGMELMEQGKKLFLDLKLFDIGNTVERAVKGVTGWGVDYLTVHGDPQVVSAAAEGRGETKTQILAVTILTSLDRGDLDAMLIRSGDVESIVIERAARAFEAGADGVIASPHEAAAIRALPQATGKRIITPGVRPAGAALGDQKRVMTPAEAISAGADQVVIGRPIAFASDPRAAAQAIQAELRGV